MRYRIKIAATDLKLLKEQLRREDACEGALFGLVRLATHEDGTDVLVRRFVEVPPYAFALRQTDQLRPHPVAINGLISLCEANDLGAMLCTSIRPPHPTLWPTTSARNAWRGSCKSACLRQRPLRACW